jgi:hypothetical protein
MANRVRFNRRSIRATECFLAELLMTSRRRWRMAGRSIAP